MAGRLLYGGVRAPDWLLNTPLVGQTMARAAAEQLAADAAASRALSGGADDARRIQTMLEVRLVMNRWRLRPCSMGFLLAMDCFVAVWMGMRLAVKYTFTASCRKAWKRCSTSPHPGLKPHATEPAWCACADCWAGHLLALVAPRSPMRPTVSEEHAMTGENVSASYKQ